VAQKEWELVQTINLEEKAHPGTIIRARALLQKRGDQMALDLFNVFTNHEPVQEPDMEKARALVDYADTISGADARE
jgi:hypothetical protein